MTSEQYHRIKTICSLVLDTPASEREAVLCRHCSGNLALEAEVRRLLSGLEAGGILDRPLVENGDLKELLDQRELVFKSGEMLADRFRTIRVLGRGGMGQVWEAFDEELREPVAIKTIRREIFYDPRAVERFKRELLNARRVSHANVCRVYDFFVHNTDQGPLPFLTMQLLRGETLADLLQRQQPLPEVLADQILDQCASALIASHAAGLIHGDFKPGNVMLVTDERGGTKAVVTDFGLARYAADETTDVTVSTPNAGTPAYMAPEQLAGCALSPSADVYAYAVVACEILTGRRPAAGGLEHLPGRWQAPIRKALDPDITRRGTVLPRAKTTAKGWRLWLAVCALIAGMIATVPLWRGAEKQHSPETLAVLPFIQESGQKEDLFISEDLSEEIISTLSRISTIRVVSGNSSSVIDTRLSEREIAGKLQVRYLLRGSIRSQGDTLEITPQLVDAAANATVWMQKYTRDRSHLVTLHSEIAHELTARLGLKYPLAQAGAFGSRVPRAEAVQLYERGRKLWSRRDPQGLRQALESFTEAIAIDQQFALAHAARADTLAIMAEASYLPAVTAFPQAKEAAIEALILDPSLPETHAALGLIESIGEWDLYNGQKSLQRAIQIGPSYVYSHQWYSGVLLKLGRYDDAIREAEVAVRLDPLSPAPLAALGWMDFYSRRYQAAVDVADLLDRDHPGFPYTCVLRGNSLTSEGAFPEALDVLSHCAPEVRQTPVYLRGLAAAQALSGNGGAATETLDEMLAIRTRQSVADSYLAAVYASLRRPDEAFYWLDQGIIHHDPLTALVNVIPFFDPIRSDSRFPQILERAGLLHKK